ncbi:MAG: PIG-L family deacetylase, partial [Anaerolineae bacterium]
MKNFYDAIYLSPHLDDAALSCGGQIFTRTSAGESVLVVTVMAGDAPPGLSSPIVEELHGRWQLPEGTVARRR